MPVVVLPDVEVMAMSFVRGNAGLLALLGNPARVATRLPMEPVFPFLRVARVGGGEFPNSPIGDAVVQWDAFAGPGDYSEASAVIRRLLAELKDYSGNAGGGVILGARILDGPVRVDETETGWARYRADTLLLVR